MKSSCSGLSLVTRSEFAVMTLGQSNNPLNGKVKNSPRQKKGETREEQNQTHAHYFFDIKEVVDKEFVPTCQIVNSLRTLAAKELNVTSQQRTI
jgi:hypothetical protein